MESTNLPVNDGREGRLLSRRNALKLGAVFTGGMLASGPMAATLASAEGMQDTTPSSSVQETIEHILQARGKASKGVFSIAIERKDIQGVMLHGVPISPAFLIHGALDFQAAGGGDEIVMNSDVCLKAGEVVPFIKQLIAHDIVFQAEHQHFYDFRPLVWFVHFRARGNAEKIARGVKAGLNATSTPFPQAPPKNAQTSLPAKEIGQILGASPHVQGDGVVAYRLPRREELRLGGVTINPNLNVETHVHFKPHGGGRNAIAAPDFGMIAAEVNKVIGQQIRDGWDIGCLYNQETAEFPQLYWSHNFKTGDCIELAHELRDSFNFMNLKFA